MPTALPATPPRIAETLARSLGVNLRAALLHGPRGDAVDPMRPATWRFLLVVERTSPDIVHRVREVWRAAAPGLPAPRLFTRAGLAGTADAYTVEFVEIRLNHELLYGEDPLEQIEFSEMRFLFELEHELQRLRLRLRQAAVLLGGRDRPLLAELLHLTPAALALFRGALRFAGETPAAEPADLLIQLSRRTALHAGGLTILAGLLHDRTGSNQIPADTLLEQFVMDVESVCELVRSFRNAPPPAAEAVPGDLLTGLAAPADAAPATPEEVPPEPAEPEPAPPAPDPQSSLPLAPADDAPASAAATLPQEPAVADAAERDADAEHEEPLAEDAFTFPPEPEKEEARPEPAPPAPDPRPSVPAPPPPAPRREEQPEFLFPC